MESTPPTQRRFAIRGWDVVRIVLGVLLLAAAGLKLAGRNVSAVPQVGWFAQPWVQLLAAEWEIVLGLWLLSGYYRVGAWLTALMIFVMFAGVSGYQGSAGLPICNCFGEIDATPWHALVVDSAALLLLAIGRPELSISSNMRPVYCWRLARPPLLVAIGAGVAFATVALVAGLAYGSPEVALARLRGQRLTLSPAYVDVGSVQPGQRLDATVELRNCTDRPIRLLGATFDCSCAILEDLPDQVPGRSTRTVRLAMTVPVSERGRNSKQMRVWSEEDVTMPLRLVVIYRVQ